MKVAKIGLAGLFAVLGVLSASASANETITYTYDALGRLVATSVSGTAPTNGQNVTTSFDPAGNRTNYAVSGAGTSISIAAANVTEGGQLSFTVTRAGFLGSSHAVNYTSANGTAIAPGDYTSVSGTLTFAVNESSKTVLVNTVDDSTAESTESFTLNLSGPTNGATLGAAAATGTIDDNDTANLAIGNATATEGASLVFTVARSGNTASAVSANFATANGTATSGSDYTSASGTVSFAANQTTANITVATTDDTSLESAETMSVTLSNPASGAVLITPTGNGTINDNDLPPANLTIDNAGTTEGGTLSFTVTRSGTTTTAVSASYSTSGGTATSGSDFTQASGTVSFAVNETSKTISIATINDTAAEPTEAMTVALSAPSSGATITTATGGGTITDNDTSINITDESLNVLPAHVSTYSCVVGGFEGDFWAFCWLNSSGINVFDIWSSPQFDPGYSSSGGVLSVQPAYYGTGVAP